MAFYRNGGNSGSKATTKYAYVAKKGTTTMSLVGDANAIYIFANLNSLTQYFTVYINDTSVSDSISTIYAYGDAWGSCAGKLTGDFKTGDVLRLDMGNISAKAHVQFIAVMEDN